MRQFAYAGAIEYDAVLQQMAKMVGKEAELYQQEKVKKVAKNRKFEEITS